jgi:hypothetical protein
MGPATATFTFTFYIGCRIEGDMPNLKQIKIVFILWCLSYSQ